VARVGRRPRRAAPADGAGTRSSPSRRRGMGDHRNAAARSETMPGPGHTAYRRSRSRGIDPGLGALPAAWPGARRWVRQSAVADRQPDSRAATVRPGGAYRQSFPYGC